MKVLIIGSGGREYAIGVALKNDEKVDEIFYAPGNGATMQFATNLDLKTFPELTNFAKENNIDLTIVGPENPLSEGIVDFFRQEGLLIFGPDKKAARLEGSKAFMKDFLQRHQIPTAKYIQTSSLKEAEEFIKSLKPPIVVKADGLCAGKGVIIAKSYDEAIETAKDMLSGKKFSDAGKKIVIEEFLDGYELSVFAVCDGKDYVILPACQDHKRLKDNDEGPNTGGMGAYCPTPLATDELMQKIEHTLIKPTIDGALKDGMPFSGVLFAGIMVVDDKPYILEYNVRFGDPECEEIMPLIKEGAFDLFYKSAKQELNSLKIKFKSKYAVGVVAASKNYPYSSSEPQEITIDNFDDEDMQISYAGVSQKDKQLIATGGRVLVCVGLGDDIKKARDKAYELMNKVHFKGKQFRKDIAYQALL